MAQTRKQIEAILSAAGTQPRHRFGQNFMIDQNLVRAVADAGLVGTNDRVIEVGPGTGTLTEEILLRGARVIAVEIDRDLAGSLRGRFTGDERFELIEGDALSGKHAINPELLRRLSADAQADDRGELKLVANLPYNIASPLVIELLIAGVALLAFTVQKEVAERLAAGAGDDAYGPLTVMAQLLGKVEILRTLPPQAFWPAPKIESSLVRVTRRANEPPRDWQAVSSFVHGVFNYRRKTLRKAITQAGLDAEKILATTKFDGTLRPEAFTPPQFLEMYEAAAKK
jgi:16S rRNA (adenine1518-N6/adenine1519-N6)-dimethyltransferase